MYDDFERFHASVEDAYLDAIASTAGCDPAVGRLSYLDDATLAPIVARIGLSEGSRVLDLGCGRGYLGRWLAARAPRVDYTALDYSAAALAAVGRHLPHATCVRGDLRAIPAQRYDAIFALESVWAVDEPLAEGLFAALEPAGMLVTTIASFDGSQDERVRTTASSLARAGFDTHPIALSAGHREFVGRLCAAALIETQSDTWIREAISGEATRVLSTLRDGTFRYDAFLSRKT